MVKQWKKLGLTVFFDEDDIQLGADIPRELEKGLKGSKHVVLALSPESLNSRWVEMETAISIYEDPSARDSRIIPIVVAPVEETKIPVTLKRLKRVDLTGNPTERKANYHRLLKKLGVKAERLPNPPSQFEQVVERTPSKSFQLTEGGQALAIGSHWDDILLGCFGTLLKLRLVFNYEVTLCVLCNQYQRKYYGFEQPTGFENNVEKIVRVIATEQGMKIRSPQGGPDTKVEDRRFHDNAKYLHTFMRELAHKYEDCNLILSPPRDDGHEDHSLTGQLVFSYFRKTYQTILEYEIKRYLEGAFVPNVFMNLDDRLQTDGKKSIGELKIDLLSRLITAKSSKIEGSSFLFGADALKARLIMQALNYGGDKSVRYGEAFRGRISL